jgi:hypothetical protein
MLKKTTIVWGSAEDQNHPNLSTARLVKITEMLQAEKIHLIEAEIVNDYTTIRFWKDQASAEEFVTFITTEAAKHGSTIVSTTIEDHVE